MDGGCRSSVRDMGYRFRPLCMVRTGKIMHLQALEDWGSGLLGGHSAP